MKYLVQQKGFMVKYDTWEKEKDLENVREAIEEFKERINIKTRFQEKRVTKDVYGKDVIWMG